MRSDIAIHAEPQPVPPTPPAFTVSLKKRLLSGGIWSLGGRVATAVTSILVNGILARLLSPDEMGAYFLIFSVATVGATLGQLGFAESSVRLVAESLGKNQPGRAAKAIRFVFLYGGLGSLAVALAWALGIGNWTSVAVFDSPVMGQLSILVAVWCFLFGMRNLLAETFRGFKDFHMAVLFGGAIHSVLAAILFTGVWLFWHEATLGQVLLLVIGSVAASNLMALALLGRKVTKLGAAGRQDPLPTGQLFNIALPLWLNQLTIFGLARVNLWILGAYHPKDEVAVYGAALTLATLVTMPLLVVGAVAPPFIAEMYARHENARLENILRTITTLAGMPTLLVLIVFALLGGPIMGLIYGDFYRQGALVLALLSLGQTVNVWTGPCDPVLRMTDHQKTIMWISLAAGFFNVAGSLLVVEKFGITGVALVTALALILQNLAALLYTKKQVGIWTHVRLAWPPVKQLLRN
ncbi:MAG: polysaccharide biosynthesis C-terminal domain-containing protein [Caldilineaceae bacterium]